LTGNSSMLYNESVVAAIDDKGSLPEIPTVR
jgi:hypothetical protein